MALELASGSTEGTKNMSLAARGFGASEAQITDVVKLCCATAALQRVAVGAVALPDEGLEQRSTVGRFATRLDGSDPDFRAADERVVASAFAEVPDGDVERLTSKDRRLIALALEAAFGSEARVEVAAGKCRQGAHRLTRTRLWPTCRRGVRGRSGGKGGRGTRRATRRG